MRVGIKLYKEAPPAKQGWDLINEEMGGRLGRFFARCNYPLSEIEYFEHSSVIMANLHEDEYFELLLTFSNLYDITILSTRIDR